MKSNFSKMHQIQCRLRLHSRPRWMGAYNAYPDPVAGSKWPYVQAKRMGEES